MENMKKFNVLTYGFGKHVNHEKMVNRKRKVVNVVYSIMQINEGHL